MHLPTRASVLRAVPVAALAIVIALLPLVVDDSFLVGKVLTFVGVNVIIVTGIALLFGYAGQISLGHAGFVGIGAYASAFATARLGWPWLAGVAFAVVLSSLGGLLLAVPSLRLRGHYLAMATLGFGEMMAIAFRELKGLTGGTDGFGQIPPPSIGPLVVRSAEANYWLVWAAVGLALLLAYNVVSLRPGRAMRAMHGSELGAQACGVDLTLLKVQVFVLSAGLAGLAGSLYAHLVGFISPSVFNVEYSVLLVAMAVVGGSGSLAGPVLAAVLLTMLPYVDAIVPGLPSDVAQAIQSWETDAYGLAIILVMLFVPGGAAGAIRRLRARSVGGGVT